VKNMGLDRYDNARTETVHVQWDIYT